MTSVIGYLTPSGGKKKQVWSLNPASNSVDWCYCISNSVLLNWALTHKTLSYSVSGLNSASFWVPQENWRCNHVTSQKLFFFFATPNQLPSLIAVFNQLSHYHMVIWLLIKTRRAKSLILILQSTRSHKLKGTSISFPPNLCRTCIGQELEKLLIYTAF